MAMTIGERIKAIRMAKGMRQADLAEKMGYSRQRISSMEARLHSPSVDTLTLFAEALDVPVIRLIDDGDWVKVTRCRNCSNYLEDGTCDMLAGLRFGPNDYCSCPNGGRTYEEMP